MIQSDVFTFPEALSSEIDFFGEGSLLEELLTEKLRKPFLDAHFRRRPVVFKGRKSRIKKLKENLFDLDVKSLLENTASENGIHVWLATKDSLESITVDDPGQADKLHRSGHSLYCRAPAALEIVVIERMIDELGVGVSRSSTDRFSRGEIELFFSRAGHRTDFHIDFQENFTVQLSGKKKWTFKSSTMVAPIRGVTPHFQFGAGKDVSEQQLKVARLADADFNADQFKEEDLLIAKAKSSSSTSPQTQPKKKCTISASTASASSSMQEEVLAGENEVVLSAGDVMYHPAGIWHRVDCLEDSISINISLIGSSYAEVICCGLQQLLWQSAEFRAPVRGGMRSRVGGASSECETGALSVVARALQVIPALVARLRPQDLLPAPCWGTEGEGKGKGEGVHAELSDDRGDDADIEVEDEEEQQEDDDDDDDDDEEEEEEEEEDIRENVINVASLCVPDDEAWLGRVGVTRMRANPLAEALDVAHLAAFGCDYSDLIRKHFGEPVVTEGGREGGDGPMRKKRRGGAQGGEEEEEVGSTGPRAPKARTTSAGSGEGGGGGEAGGDGRVLALVVHCSFGNETLESLTRTVVGIPAEGGGATDPLRLAWVAVRERISASRIEWTRLLGGHAGGSSAMEVVSKGFTVSEIAQSVMAAMGSTQQSATGVLRKKKLKAVVQGDREGGRVDGTKCLGAAWRVMEGLRLAGALTQIEA